MLLPTAPPRNTFPYGLVGARSRARMPAEHVSAAISRVVRMAVLLKGAVLPCGGAILGCCATPTNEYGYVMFRACLWAHRQQRSVCSASFRLS
jgi:hypothetical protein